MKYLKMLGLAAVAAMALMAVTAGSASATTLEIGGTVQSKAVSISASAEGTILLSDTENTQANTCSVSSVSGETSVFSGEKVTGPLKELSFTTCTRSPVTVNSPGQLYIIWEGGESSTSGSVFSENADVTVPTTFGFSVTCTTLPGGTKIGTLVGVKSSSEHATLSVSAVLSCGFLLPSASWSGTYKVTTPTGLGVRS
jgi:hypothetical protein